MEDRAQGSPARRPPGAGLRRQLALLALDAVSAALEAGRWLAALFTVWCDPLWRSCAPIRLHGRCKYAGFRVTSAPSEFERRAVAWFYRWHEAPDDADWRACLSRFGLDAPPAHTLRLEGADGAPDPAPVKVVSVSLATPAAGGTRHLRRVFGDREPAEVSGATPLGGLAPESFIRDLDRADRAATPGSPARAAGELHS